MKAHPLSGEGVKVLETGLPQTLLVQPEVFGDERGFFMETWNAARYARSGLDVTFAQENVSFSRRGVLRGLHFQHPHGQGKLVQVLQGEVFDVAVDVRVGSPNFGKWTGTELSSRNRSQLYIPPGFAHGFCVTGDSALVLYKCTALWSPAHERCIRWDDTDLGIQWPIGTPTLSQRDQSGRRLRDFGAGELPPFQE